MFGAAAERALCETVAEPLRRAGIDARNLAGETTLREFIDLAAACRLFLTNDSGAMHVASALGVPTVAVFGATDDTTTGPTGPLGARGPRARRVQPVPAARMPHRSPLHDARGSGERHRGSVAPAEPMHEHKWTHETKS